MSEAQIYRALLVASFVLAPATFIVLFHVNAPYGRHARRGWGRLLPDRWGWLLMEAPAALLMVGLFWRGAAPKTAVTAVFLALWLAHYLHRAFVYPFQISAPARRMSSAVVLLALGFNAGNAYLNGRWLFHFAPAYPAQWLADPRFIGGALLFSGGYLINRWADRTLRDLRQPGESGYRVPEGGLYRWISCPNYLGEILEWCGWALATWSLPGLSFAVWTVANLAPRASAHHRWYRQHFAGYPPERKALLPGVW